MAFGFLSFSKSPASTTTTVPDVQALFSILDTITDRTRKLDDDLRKWQGDYLGAILILTKSVGIINDINACADIVQAGQSWTEDDAEQTSVAIRKLLQILTATIDSTIRVRPQFAKIPLLGDNVAVSMLRRERSAVANLSSVFHHKVRPNRKEEAEMLGKEFDKQFVRALEAFGVKPSSR